MEEIFGDEVRFLAPRSRYSSRTRMLRNHHFDARAGMNLQGDDAAREYAHFGFGVVHGAHPVEGKADVTPVRANGVRVPTGFIELVNRRLRRLHQHFLSARFIVEAAPILLAYVCLIAEQLVLLLGVDAAKLDAAIAHAVGETKLKGEFEILERLRPQEVVPLLAAMLADDHAVARAPYVGR
ncbi:MAG: hypothetical protein U5J83_16525, partial [Bryobacterales bacterium]|nr:hypothetical protein [Bryobacterales bacterium]